MILRDAIPDVPSGVSSLTTQLLPELFPTPDEQSFRRTVNGSLGILEPPAPAFEVIATTFDPLGALRSQGFFDSAAKHRVAVFITDGESGRFDPQGVGMELSGAQRQPGFGRSSRVPQPPVKLLIVRVGTPRDRIYRAGGTIDPGYRPDLAAGDIIANFAQAADGRAFDVRHLGSAKAALRAAAESGPSSTMPADRTTTSLAVYSALLACLPLGFIVWRRSLVAL